MGQAQDLVKDWPEEKQKHVMKKLIQASRHGISLAHPNLASKQEVDDMNLALDGFEEILKEEEQPNGLEDLPEMSEEEAAAPDSPPVSEPEGNEPAELPTASTEGEV